MNIIPIYFNGEARTVPEDSTLRQALALLVPGGMPDGMPLATALNGNHVSRSQRERTRVSAGDHITTFTPIVGG